MVQLSNPYVTTGKDIVLTIQTFVGKVMSLLFNKLSRFIINEDHGIWSHPFMANGETMEIMTDFIFLGSKITSDDDCSHEIKRYLLLGTKAMTNLESVLKSRDSTLPTKVCIVKAMVFSVVMYGCESWTIKKAECPRTDAFELWC